MKLDKFTVGRRYGKALFEATEEKGMLPETYQELRSLRKIFLEVPDLGNILTDARLEPNEKDEIFQVIFPHFSPLVENFLQVVYDYHRMDDLVLMIDEFEKRYDAHRGILYGTVKSVVPLNESQLKALEEKAGQVFGAENVNLTNQIDEKIVGGVVVEAGDLIIDGSILKQLENLRKTLLK